MAHWGWWEDGWNMSPVARRGEIPEYSYFLSRNHVALVTLTWRVTTAFTVSSLSHLPN